MGNRKLGILLFIVLLISISCVSAQDFNVNVVSVQDKISSNESAVFNLTLKNYKEEDRITLSSKDPRWSLLTKPLTHFTSGILIGNKSTGKTVVYLTPVDLAVGKYKVGLDVTSSNTGSTQEVLLNITIGSYVAGKPVLVIGLELVPAITLPGNKVSVKVNLENRNNLNLKNLSLDIISNLINTKKSFDLQAYEKKTIEITSDIGKTVEAQEDNLRVIIKKEGEVVGEAGAVLSILTSLPEFKKETTTSSGFFKTVDELTITNDGNARIIQTVKVPAGFFKRIFTSADPKAKVIKEEGVKYISWEIDLAAGESARVVITRDYRTFSLIIVLIISMIIAYYLLRSSLYVKKIAVKAAKKEGGIGELNIMLKIRNRRNKEIQDVMVEDSIPKIADLIKEEYIGTLAPSSVFKHEAKGTVLRWDIGSLEPKEERLLRYRLRCRLSILGAFHLPQIKVKFKEDEKPSIVYSRKVRVVG